MSAAKGYSTKSKAKEGAVRKGLDPTGLTFVQDEAGRWTWQQAEPTDDEVPPKVLDDVSDEPDITLSDTPDLTPEDDGPPLDATQEELAEFEDEADRVACASDPRQEALPDPADDADPFAGVATVKIVDFGGGDYGSASVTDAVDMAQMIADSDGTRVELLHPDTGAVLYAVQPEADQTPALPEVEKPVLVVVPALAEAFNMGGLIEAGSARAATEAEMAATPEPDSVPEPEAPAEPGKRFILCIESGFPQTSPEAWAIEYSRKLKLPLVIRDADSHEVVKTVDAVAMKRQKAARATPPKVAHDPSAPKGKGASQRLAEALDDPNGKTHADLNKAVGWAHGPSPSTLANLAARQKKELETFVVDGVKRYRWRVEQDRLAAD